VDIYTLGTDRRTEEDFIEILNFYEVETIIDVRRFPRSKIPIFNRINLERLLKENGMEYYLLGNELGGFREKGYLEYTDTEEFRKGIEMLEAVAREKKSAVLCAEKFPWKCHRRWIARELKRRNWHIIHIIDKGKIWEPA
jgi:uncharacterized protein (DUF488 family)